MKLAIVIIVSTLACGCRDYDSANKSADKTQYLASQLQIDTLRERGIPDMIEIDNDQWSTWTYRKSKDLPVVIKFCQSGQHLMYIREDGKGLFTTHCGVDTGNTKSIKTVDEANELLRYINKKDQNGQQAAPRNR